MIPEAAAAITEAEFEVYFRLVWLFVIIMFFLMALVGYLCVAMWRAREREAESRAFSRLVIAGQEAERRRITRELHDTVLPEVWRLAGTGGAAADGRTVIRQQQILTGRLREICAGLMPPDFTRLSLKDSLNGLCASFQKRTGIECLPSVEEIPGIEGIGAENQLHLYRMVQEALTNIEKHAGARRAVLVVRRLKRERGEKRNKAQRSGILVCVSDDGAGLPSEPHPSSGLGMRSMKERAAVLGARLDFISESGNGLMVRIEALIK